MFKRALICTDFEDGIDRLTQFVPALATGGLETLVFFHNVALTAEREIPKIDTEAVEQAQAKLAIATQSVPDGITVKVEVASGRPVDNILKAAREYDIEVVVLGTPTRSLLTERLFGSTTVGITKQCPVPLLILRPQLVAIYRQAELALRCEHLFEYPLIPFDGSQSSQALVAQIKQRAVSAKAVKQVLLCWVIDDSIRKELRGDDPVGHANEVMAPVKAELEAVGLTVETDVRLGEPQQEILKSAEVNDVTGIAVSTSGGGLLKKFSSPSLTSALIRSSWHPLLYFPREKD
ncbi:MAG: universal stress protein [Cyanobacteria bacterium P01_A01_bin.105]